MYVFVLLVVYDEDMAISDHRTVCNQDSAACR